MDTPTLHRRLRRVFDARVFNHGDYNVVYGQPSGSSSPLVIGYRHQPLEMLLCPFDPTSTPDDHDRRAPGVAEDDDPGFDHEHRPTKNSLEIARLAPRLPARLSLIHI